MNKNKLVIGLAMAGGIVLALASFAGAASTGLTASCNGAVAGNSIQWTATASSGTAPFAYLWSGTNIGGSTSSVVTSTYAPGTYTSSISITDASSSLATSTCSGTVAQPVPPSTTSTHPFFKKPELSINPNGKFTAHGMVVQSVSGNSFTGIVWGTTWTVNVFNPSSTDFFFREGRHFGSIDLSQIRVGDEVGVNGTVDPSHPLTVNGRILRNYSIVVPRPHHEDSDDEDRGNGRGDDKKGNNNESSINDMRGRLQGMLQQLQQLRIRLHGKGDGKGGENN